MTSITMTPDSPAYKKLLRMERLLKLKDRIAIEKVAAQEFLTGLTQPLIDAAKLAEVDIELDRPLVEYLTKFDEELHKIEHELLQMAG